MSTKEQTTMFISIFGENNEFLFIHNKIAVIAEGLQFEFVLNNVCHSYTTRADAYIKLNTERS